MNAEPIRQAIFVCHCEERCETHDARACEGGHENLKSTFGF